MIRLTCAEYGSCTEPATHFYTFWSGRRQGEQAIPVCTDHLAHASGLCRPIDELVIELRTQAEDASVMARQVAP